MLIIFANLWSKLLIFKSPIFIEKQKDMLIIFVTYNKDLYLDLQTCTRNESSRIFCIKWYNATREDFSNVIFLPNSNFNTCFVKNFKEVYLTETKEKSFPMYKCYVSLLY